MYQIAWYFRTRFFAQKTIAIVIVATITTTNTDHTLEGQMFSSVALAQYHFQFIRKLGVGYPTTFVAHQIMYSDFHFL